MELQIVRRRLVRARKRRPKNLKITGIQSIHLKDGSAHFTFFRETIEHGRVVRKVLQPVIIVEMRNLPTCIAQANAAVIQHARRQIMRAIGYGGETIH